MRLEPIPPDQLNDQQRALHDDMKAMTDAHLQGFVSQRDDGALVGPFGPLLHFPQWGAGVWAQTKSLMEHTVVPKPAHEVAILLTGAALHSRYELYAHQRVADGAGLAKAKIATIVAGQRPSDLDDTEAAAFDLTAALMRGGSVPDATYNAALEALGDEATAELIFLVGGYTLVSTLLNGFAVPVPGSDD